MKKRIFAVLTILCLLFAAACLAEEENQVDISFEGYMEAGGKLCVTWTDEADELDGLGLIGTVGQTIGEMLQHNDILSVEPMLEGDVFEGWVEVAVAVTIDEFGFEENEYSLIPDAIYTTEELLNLPVPDHNVTYVAKWAGIPAEEYFAPYEEEMIVMPSITLLTGEGAMLMNSDEGQYETTMSVATVEPGQAFGEVLGLDSIAAMTAEGKMFTGWTVYEYNIEAMETSETCVEEDGVLCFEVFEDYYMVLREYTACAEMLTTEKLAEYACEASDHVVVANWMTAEEYVALVKEQSDAIRTSLENDPLTQADMNQKSQELRELWDAAVNNLLTEAQNVLSAEEMGALTAEQTAWLESTEAAVEAAGKEVEGGSMYVLVVNMEAANLTEARANEIYEMLK